jgi:hypothetical protein
LSDPYIAPLQRRNGAAKDAQRIARNGMDRDRQPPHVALVGAGPKVTL